MIESSRGCVGKLLRLVGTKVVDEDDDCCKLFGEEFDWKCVDEDDWRFFEGDIEEGKFVVPMKEEDWLLFEEEFGDCWKAVVETVRLLVSLFEDWKLGEDPDDEWKLFDDDW